jgi:two-component system sensor histidine kinase CpxA
MKVTYPLSLKVSVWLLLNLLLLAALGIGFLVVQGGLGWDSLVAGSSGNRAQATANIIAGETSAATAETRSEVLARFGAAFEADFHLFRMDGLQVAGATVELPSEVRARVAIAPTGGRGFGRGGEFGPGRDGRRGDFKGPKREPNDKAEREPPPEPKGRLEPPLDPSRDRGRFIVRTAAPAAYWVGLRVPFSTNERARFIGPIMLVARVESLWSLLRFLDLQTWLFAGTGVLALSVVFWLPLVRGITQSLGQLTMATEQIADGRFDTRVPANRRDEIGRLGESVNRMATRLETHMAGQKRFLGDVAHELCSPLARLQLASGILAERAPKELHETVADLRDEVQQMSTLVNELLAFTKAGLQQREVACEKVALEPLVRDAIDRENGGDRVTVGVQAGLSVLAEPNLLARAISNLVRNALRYAGAEAAISVTAVRNGNRAIITIDDDGPGVPAEALDRLGEPFFRPEAARTRELGGVGLGLSIVRAAVASCSGEVRFSNRSPHGFRAEIILASA